MRTTGMWRPHGDNTETTWGQHEDNLDLIEVNMWVNGWGQVISIKIK